MLWTGTEGAVGQAELMFAALERNQRAKATMIPSADTGYLGRKVGSQCAVRPQTAVAVTCSTLCHTGHVSHLDLAHTLL